MNDLEDDTYFLTQYEVLMSRLHYYGTWSNGPFVEQCFEIGQKCNLKMSHCCLPQRLKSKFFFNRPASLKKPVNEKKNPKPLILAYIPWNIYCTIFTIFSAL